MREVRVGWEGLQKIADLESPIEVVIKSLVGRLRGNSQLRKGSLVSFAADKLYAIA